jgi:hypothetical protein
VSDLLADKSDLVMWVADAQAQQHAIVAALIEAFVTGEQQLADAIQRVVLAAAVAERLVLRPTAHLVDAAVPDAHHVKWIGHPEPALDVKST